MVDLHAHSDCSDGTFHPERLVDLAREAGLRALSITDHDSVEAYHLAAPQARQQGLDLICGVELNTRLQQRVIHILGYFPGAPPDDGFRQRLEALQRGRRERNHRLAARLRELGLEVEIEEAERLGRGQTGRPHFAQVLVEKGYAPSVREAFDRYLDEQAAGYVERRDAPLQDVLHWIREAGGVSSWAHPGLFFRETKANPLSVLRQLQEDGLDAVEVYHPDHGPGDVALLRSAAESLALGQTGGSDFHDPERSSMPLGGLNLPDSLLEDLRALHRRLGE